MGKITFKKGEKVKYIGPDLIAYETGKVYIVTGYDSKLDCYSVMSELDESYMVGADCLEKIGGSSK